jgi:calcineurin-like phosphoesterase family protein
MSKIFLVSDSHISHSNIISYCNRPFANVREMDETLINNWNSVVSSNDTVYFLGDFAFANNGKIRATLNRLNRKKLIFIKGNHDLRITDKKWLEMGVDEVHRELEINLLGERVLLSHFPYLALYPSDTRYSKMFPNNKGLILAHGHVHSKPVDKIRVVDGSIMFDVGVDANLFYPVLAEDFISEIRGKHGNFDAV